MSKKKLQLFYLYSKDFLFFTTLISLLTYYIVLQVGLSALTPVIWFKIVMSGIGLIVHQNRKAQEIFFYMNIGWGKNKLLGYALLTDLSLWLSGMILLLKAN